MAAEEALLWVVEAAAGALLLVAAAAVEEREAERELEGAGVGECKRRWVWAVCLRAECPNCAPQAGPLHTRLVLVLMLGRLCLPTHRSHMHQPHVHPHPSHIQQPHVHPHPHPSHMHLPTVMPMRRLPLPFQA